MRVAKALKQKCKKGDTFYLLKRVLSQVGGIYLLVIPFAANHHWRQARIRAWKQQFQAKSIHAIEIVSIQPLCSDEPQASIQSEGTLICNFCFECHLLTARFHHYPNRSSNQFSGYSPSSVGLEDDEHGDVAPEGAPVLPHLAHHRAHALSLLGIERLRNPPIANPEKRKNGRTPRASSNQIRRKLTSPARFERRGAEKGGAHVRGR